MKNFSFLIIFSLPFKKILVERNILRQNPVQYPINFPPNKTIFGGIIKLGKNKIEIKTIPEKKINEKKKLLII